MALTESEDGNEHSAAILEYLADGAGKALHFLFTSVVRVTVSEAVGAFHDENVHPTLRKISATDKGLVVKLYVACVEDCRATLPLEHYATGAENMAGIVKGCKNGAIVTGAERFVVRACYPRMHMALQFAVGEEGVLNDTFAHALGCHHVH